MILFTDPDEYESLSRLNLPVNVISCPGLEALTGADFCLSLLPINPVSNIQFHIDKGTMFVNIKRGYDLVTNHEQRLKFAARSQCLGIKPGRKLYLGVGEYKDSNGSLQVAGYKAIEKVPYSTYLQIQLDAINRGMQWLTIPSSEYLADFLKSCEKTLSGPESIEVFTKASYSWTPDDFWQTVEEVDKESVEHILACGLPGFGPKTVNGLIEFMKVQSIPVSLFNALSTLSMCDEKGKQVYNVPGIGIEKFKRIRRWLFNWQTDFNGEKVDCEDKNIVTWNLSIKRFQNGESEYLRGVNGALEFFVMRFKYLVEVEKMSAKQAFNVAAQATKATAEAIYKPVLDTEDGIPF